LALGWPGQRGGNAGESQGQPPAEPQVTEPIALPERPYRHLDMVDVVGNGYDIVRSLPQGADLAFERQQDPEQAWVGAGTGVDDGDSGCHHRSDGGKAIAVRPPAGDPSSRPARHWAAGGLLFTPGQGRGNLAALDSDELSPGVYALPARVGGLEDDPLDVRPRDEHNRAAAGRQFVRHGAKRDSDVVGAKSDHAAGNVDHAPALRGQGQGSRRLRRSRRRSPARA
jgi:hypothetical protein